MVKIVLRQSIENLFDYDNGTAGGAKSSGGGGVDDDAMAAMMVTRQISFYLISISYFIYLFIL